MLRSMETALRVEARQLRLVAPRGRKSVLRYYWMRWTGPNGFLNECRLERELRHRSAQTWTNLQSWLQVHDDIHYGKK